MVSRVLGSNYDPGWLVDLDQPVQVRTHGPGVNYRTHSFKHRSSCCHETGDECLVAIHSSTWVISIPWYLWETGSMTLYRYQMQMLQSLYKLTQYLHTSYEPSPTYFKSSLAYL